MTPVVRALTHQISGCGWLISPSYKLTQSVHVYYDKCNIPMPHKYIQDNTLLSQGSSFFHGVRFSVQTISLGKVPYLRYVESFALPLGHRPIGRNEIEGEMETSCLR